MGTDSVIYIRTDGNANIATGHIVRCLCIAQAVETLGKSVCFLVSDTESADLLQDLSLSLFQGYSFSFEVKVLETAVYNDLDKEIQELKHMMNQSIDKPVVFIDSYYVTPTYLDSLRFFAKVAYMDDLRAFDYHVDLVVNYDVIPPSKEQEYQKAYTNASIKLLGAQYTPLRRQFQNQNVSLRKEIQNILITTGGSDPYHFTEILTTYLLLQKYNIDFHIVVGKLFNNTESLKELAKQNPSVHLHYNVIDMAALMKQCDYAISAAGTTLYELCALGIPAISFTMADNQITMAETFSETGAIPYAGDIRSTYNLSLAPNVNKNTDTFSHINAPTQSILSNMKEHLLSSIECYSVRINQQQNMRRLITGNGALQIADVLCNLHI